MTDRSQGMRLSFDLGGAQEQRRLPFRMIVLGDFSAGCGAHPRGRRIAVSKETLSETLAALGATLAFEVPNYLDPRGGRLDVTINLTDFSDITPAGIIAHVPDLTLVYLFKERLQLFVRGETGAREFAAGLNAYERCTALTGPLRRCRAALEQAKVAPARPAPAEPAPPASDASIERILDLIAAPSREAAPRPAHGHEEVIASIGRERARPEVPEGITAALDEVSALLDRQINAILHHAVFRRIEATWRGLKLLLDHAGAGDTAIELVDTTRADLESIFADEVVAAAAGEDVPAGLVLLDFAFDTSPRDTTLLQALGESAMELQAPVLFSVVPEFFGPVPSDAHPLPFLGSVMDQPQYTAWNSLRGKECARWLCGAYNRFTLRAPYTRANTQGLDFTEAAPDTANVLWGNPAWVIAALVARSASVTHWPTQITGMQHGQLSGMELHAYPTRAQGELQIPLDSLLTMQNAEDIANCGLAPLLCQPNRDAVYALYVPTLRRGAAARKREDDELISLPYQLLAARVTALLSAQREQMADAGSDEATAQRTQRVLDSLLADTGPGHTAQVTLMRDPDHKERRLLELELHTGRDVLNGATLHLTVPV